MLSISLFYYLFCRYSHDLVSVAMTIVAHKEPVKSLGVLAMPDGPRLLSGSTDSTVMVCCSYARIFDLLLIDYHYYW